MNKKVGFIFIMFLLTACAILLLYFSIFPPIEGYYKSMFYEYMSDHSSGFLHLSDGKVFSINIDGDSGDRRELIGAYRKTSRNAIEITNRERPLRLTDEVSFHLLGGRIKDPGGHYASWTELDYCKLFRVFDQNLIKRLEGVPLPVDELDRSPD